MVCQGTHILERYRWKILKLCQINGLMLGLTPVVFSHLANYVNPKNSSAAVMVNRIYGHSGYMVNLSWSWRWPSNRDALYMYLGKTQVIFACGAAQRRPTSQLAVICRRWPNPCLQQLTFGASNVHELTLHWMHQRSAVESKDFADVWSMLSKRKLTNNLKKW